VPEHDDGDGSTPPDLDETLRGFARVVLVSITAAGSAALEEKTEHVRGVLREALSEFPESDIATLIATGDVFERFIERLQSKVSRQ
jgi:DNA-binding MarR family transcriptional regulator